METQASQMPKIGEPAPEFEAVTTTGTIKFSEYRNKQWTIMFSHPADFTPVCTTEMSEFAKEQAWFDQKQTKLIGLSIDSIHSHLAWVNNVREKTGIYMKFPIIADIDMKVAKLYGMLHESISTTAAVRAVFFIDPKGIIRLIMYYPLNVGRNMKEIKRVLTALQTVDAHQCALPINWEPGDKAIIPPPKNLVEMDERLADTKNEKVDFYLLKKELQLK